MKLAIAILLMTAVFPVVVLAQKASHSKAATDQEVFGPYWTAEPGWHTEFQLRNNISSAPLIVTPVLRLTSGQEYPLTSVSIPAGDVVTVDVRQELEKSLPALIDKVGAFGSVVFRFVSPYHANLYAAVMVHLFGQPIGYHIDTVALDSTYNVGSREGIWWLPRTGVQDNLIIANGSDQANQGRLFLYDPTGKTWHQDVSLGPKQTVRLVVADLVKAAGFNGTYGGLKFEVGQGAGSIDTVHILYDVSAGFSATMKMFDHDPAAKLEERLWGGNTLWTTWAPMLALQQPDPALALPAGTLLHPQVLLRNTTPRPQTANVKLRWRGASSNGLLKLPAIQLQPLETHLMDVEAVQQAKQIPLDAHWTSVEISSSTAQPDDLIAIASSYDTTGRYGAQTPFSDQLADHWVGGEWQADLTHNSLIAVTNAGKKPEEALVTFHYNHGQSHYEIQKTIAPGDQLWLNMGDIIRLAIADRNGQTFPPDLTYGTYDIRQPNGFGTPSLFEGKIIVDKRYGHLAYSCVHCCGHDNPWIQADPEILAVLGQDTLGVWADNNCSLTTDDMTSVFSGFDTLNHAVATMASTKITGTGSGSTNAFGSGSYNFASDTGLTCPIKSYKPQNVTNVNPTVTIDSFVPNPVLAGSAANVHITVNPSANIDLTIANSGTGRAIFGTSGTKTTTSIPDTTVINITGTSLSSNGATDLLLTASFQGTLLARQVFSVTSGACTATLSGHGGDGLESCPASVAVYDTYNLVQFCPTCTFSCLAIGYDSTFTPSQCSAVFGGLGGSGDRVLTSTQSGSFHATDCLIHQFQIQTTVTSATGTILQYKTPTGVHGLRCNATSKGLC